MPIPSEITDILSEIGLPAGAIALAVGLVRGAGALEKEASEPALKYVSGLLIRGGLSNLGKLGATLVPRLFDRIFGSRPLSYRFISRSLLATTVFWIILLEIKHPDWSHVIARLIGDLWPNNNYLIIILPLWYIVDWLSLIKARLLMKIITTYKYSLTSTGTFVIIDLASY